MRKIKDGEWIGVDFDGTLAYYDSGQKELGPPIPAMVQRIKEWLHLGYEVRIFTARVGNRPFWEQAATTTKIQEWLLAHGLPALQVTATKDYKMTVLYDDRVVQVEHNTGRLIVDDT